MPCDFLGFDDGSMEIVCSRPGEEICQVVPCGRPSTRLCDWPIRRNKTCDMKLCNGHAYRPRPDVDWCPIHRMMQGEKER